MPRKYSIVEKREWLERSENGEADASIAKDPKRDIKTIRAGIEAARIEKYAANAQAELIKDRLTEHHSQLEDVISRTLAALVMPPALSVGKTSVALSESMITSVLKKGMVLVLSDENTLKWKLLREHLRFDRLWNNLDKWKKAMIAHIQSRVAFFNLELKRSLESSTGLWIEDKGGAKPFLHALTVGQLYQGVMSVLLNGSGLDGLERSLTVDTTEGVVRYESWTLAKCPGAELECREKVLKAVAESLKSGKARAVLTTYKLIEPPLAKCRGPLEEISLLGIVPGKCRVCRRLGI